MCGPKTVGWLHIQDFELDAAFELGLLRGKWMRATAERLERWLLRNFQRVSSISEAMRKRAINKGVSKGRAGLLPNWVDLSVICPHAEEQRLRNPYRNELGIEDKQLVILYSGSMNKKQGLELVVQAIEAVGDTEDVVWVLGGEGPGKAALIDATRHLPQVRHVGLQPSDRLNEWLNFADIHLLPQKEAAADLVLPSKVLGILASGRPMVAASPAGSTLGQLATQTGRRVNPGDAVGFAEAVKELARNGEDRRILGAKARMLAEEKYGLTATLQRFEQEARSALDEQGRIQDGV
jgi:colanic acid biosynthesis glycosyl transferase WcaI